MTSSLNFDPIGCATVNFHIVLVTFIAAIIAAIPMVLVARGWIYDKMDLNVRRYLWFPMSGIALHLVYVGYRYFTDWGDFGCLTWLNIF